jgi:hypothetical protein
MRPPPGLISLAFSASDSLIAAKSLISCTSIPNASVKKSFATFFRLPLVTFFTSHRSFIATSTSPPPKIWLGFQSGGGGAGYPRNSRVNLLQCRRRLTFSFSPRQAAATTHLDWYDAAFGHKIAFCVAAFRHPVDATQLHQVL